MKCCTKSMVVFLLQATLWHAKKIAFLQEFVNFYFIVVFLFPPSKHV